MSRSGQKISGNKSYVVMNPNEIRECLQGSVKHAGHGWCCISASGVRVKN